MVGFSNYSQYPTVNKAHFGVTNNKLDVYVVFVRMPDNISNEISVDLMKTLICLLEVLDWNLIEIFGDYMKGYFSRNITLDSVDLIDIIFLSNLL